MTASGLYHNYANISNELKMSSVPRRAMHFVIISLKLCIHVLNSEKLKEMLLGK